MQTLDSMKMVFAQVNITLDMQGGRAMQKATDGNIGSRLGVLFVEQKSRSSLSVDETGKYNCSNFLCGEKI